MAYVYHIVAIRVNETSWAHVCRLRFRYLGTGCDSKAVVRLASAMKKWVTALGQCGMGK
jgi:hypothetical protein